MSASQSNQGADANTEVNTRLTKREPYIVPPSTLNTTLTHVNEAAELIIWYFRMARRVGAAIILAVLIYLAFSWYYLPRTVLYDCLGLKAFTCLPKATRVYFPDWISSWI